MDLTIKKQLMELFPNLSNKDAELLASTGDNINILITRVLDNNISGPTVDIKDIARKPFVVQKYSNDDLKYPEVFEKFSSIDIHEDVSSLRSKASKCFEEASKMGLKAQTHEIKPSRIHFSIEADELRQKANEYNRKAAMILMRRAVENKGAYDLHGLHVSEALDFVEDLYKFYRFKEIVFITGQEYKSSKIRPAVKKWLIDHNFTVVNEGPTIKAFRNFGL